MARRTNLSASLVFWMGWGGFFTDEHELGRLFEFVEEEWWWSCV
jgi:hypothetical protein